ncbi:YkvA family protein [Curtobacterium sp. 458]|uniref:YkvA family protein n=1 Tax=Curtobacterium sp. 458 TaxID=3050069 RepID=UPI0025B4DAA8|nr:YkvA family protein [Curtobacterium sp. 458]WJX99421.1 YkvA family protein [Curtobacterium sp. 458]
MTALEVVASAVGGLLLAWLVVVAALWVEQRRHADRSSLRELLRLAPDVVRLLRRLVVDRTVRVSVRAWLVVLLAYLLSPIDLVPDFVPVLGWLDDALIVVIALRFVVRSAGADALVRHWPGSPGGLRALRRVAGVTLPG